MDAQNDMPVVLALDLATVTGFALRGRDGKTNSGRVRLPAYEEGREGVRMLKLFEWLDKKKAEATGRIDHVSWENAFHQKGSAGELFDNFVGVIRMWCEKNGASYSWVSVRTLKKHATGTGNADKDQMVGAARRLGFKVIDHNEADAIHVLRYMLATEPKLSKPLTP